MTAYNKKWNINKDICDFDDVSLYPSAMSRLYNVEDIPIVIKPNQLNLEFLSRQSAYTVETTEKEIVLDFEDMNDEPTEAKPKCATKFLEQKQVVDLTDEERALQTLKSGLISQILTLNFSKMVNIESLRRKNKHQQFHKKQSKKLHC